MKHIERTEIRKRETDTSTYYVIGEKVRTDFLTITAELNNTVQLGNIPANWNNNDKDALETMHHWLEDDRDFNIRQLTKFFKMLNKFGLPDNFNALSKQLDWHFGKNLTKSEMFDVMQERRDNARQAKIEDTSPIHLKAYTQRTTYESLFTEDQ